MAKKPFYPEGHDNQTEVGHFYPEVIAPDIKSGDKQWEIHEPETCPRVNAEQRIAEIPRGRNNIDYFSRVHELAHVKLSPLRKPTDVNDLILNSVEDMRVNGWATRVARVPLKVYKEDETAEHYQIRAKEQAKAISTFVQLPPYLQFLSALSAKDSNFEEVLKPFQSRDVTDCIDRAHKLLWADGVPTFSRVHELARWLQFLIAEEEEDMQQVAVALQEALDGIPVRKVGEGELEDGDGPPNAKAQGAVQGDGTSKGDSDESDPTELHVNPYSVPKVPVNSIHYNKFKVPSSYLKKFYSTLGDRVGKLITDKVDGKPSTQSAEYYPWNDMRILMPDMPHPALPPKDKAMRNKFNATDRGSVPTHMHRYHVDLAIFGRKTKKQEGISILVDTSGSMSLDEEDMTRILTECPAATVASYSGPCSGSRGTLIILARGKRRVALDNVPSAGGCNTIDLPALQWLARQPGPRYWLSDGGVTGKDNMGSARNSRQVWDLLKQADIFQVFDVDELIKVMTGKQKLKPIRLYKLDWT